MINLVDLIKAQLEYFGLVNSADITNEQIIADLIKEQKGTLLPMKQGVDYYQAKNDQVKAKRRYYLDNGQPIVDQTKVNHTIAHAFHKILVDQKVGYLVSNPMTFSAEDKNYEQKVNELLNDKWDDTVNELVKNAANKGVEYLHVFIDEDGNFDYNVMPAEGIVPIYDTETQSKIVAVVRYYKMRDANNNEFIKAEYWDDQTVTYYANDYNGEFKFDTTEAINPASHFYYNGKGYGWGKVPFIEFRNNEEKMSDLSFYKDLIDEYDLRVSDLADNLHDIQNFVYVLKNYMGTDLKEFMTDLRFHKAIKVGMDGGVDTLAQELPSATLTGHLNRLEENIFAMGQGINVNTDEFGNSSSGVALKFLYQPLDFKCNILERKFKAAIRTLIWFATEYLTISGQGKYDYQTVNVIFNKTIINNAKEMVDMAAGSVGIISNETIIAHHPWVDNVEQEMSRLEKQNANITVDNTDDNADETVQ